MTLNPLAWYERYLVLKLEHAENYLGGLVCANAEFPGAHAADISAQKKVSDRIERRLLTVRRWLGLPLADLSPQ